MLEVPLFIELRNALARGSARAGETTVRLSDSDVASLSREQRDVLADAIDKRTPLGRGFAVGHKFYQDPPIGEASIDAVKTVLTARLAAIDSFRAEQEHVRKAMAKWVRRHGSASQKERIKEDLLPYEEVLAAIRTHVFAPLAQFRRFTRMKPASVCNHKTCSCRRGKVHFDTVKGGRLRDDQFAMLKELRAAAPKDATIEVREHIGRCDGCTCKKRRWGVSITIDWEGVPLTLEYALDKSEEDNGGGK